ncbi:MAG: sulfotransferase domain-containing protein [Bacteroidota bacterium]
MFTDEDMYLNQCFYKASKKKLAGEGTIWYLYSREAVPNILEFQPDAKFIVMIRDPVEIAYAMYSEHLSRKVNEDVEDFETAWNLQEIRMKGKHLPPDCRDPKLVQYREIAMIGKQIHRLYKHVNKDRVKIMLFDEFKANNKAIYEETLEFLGIKSDNKEHFPVINQNRKFKYPGLAKVFSKIGFAAPYVLLIKRLIGIPEGVSLFRAVDKAQVIYKKRKPIDPEFRKHLVNEFKNDVLLLQSLINRDLSHWLD